MAPGNSQPTRGVAIIARRRRRTCITNFHPISERFACMGASSRGFRMRLATAQFPRSGYADRHA
eukprot:5631991-Pyramimonas_sp.AAC.1